MLITNDEQHDSHKMVDHTMQRYCWLIAVLLVSQVGIF